jgi:hypothetical protein
MNFCRHLVSAALLIGAPVGFAQWIDPDPSSQGPYMHTPDKVAIGSAIAPVKQLEVSGDARVSGSLSGGKEILVTGWNSAYGRLHAAVPNWIAMTQNTFFQYPDGWVLDDPALPGWFVKLDGRQNVDKLSVYRVPVGAGVHTDEKELFTIGANGATVIGPPNATGNMLTVNGNANFTGTVTGGNIQAKYQDIAEWVPAIGELEAGTVVIVAPGQVNSVIASSAPYDSRVAGVVSSQPGLILGEAGASTVMVATTGRVRVRADATKSPISAGDLLVTSSRTGMAMRSEPIDIGGVTIHRPGTVVGKALEPLASGTGEVLVLLSLQ